VREHVADLGTITTRPLAVGFGLSDAASLTAVRAMGATPVIGSALVRELAGGRSLSACLAQLL
jgi:tryptophan synthase alpha chain